MGASTFDTNRYANRLVAAGVARESADIQAEAIGAMMQAILDLDANVEKYHASDMVEFGAIRGQLSQLEAKVTKELAGQHEQIAVLEAKVTKELAGQHEQIAVLEAKLIKEASKHQEQTSLLDAKFSKEVAEQRVLISEVEKRLMRWILIVGGALGIIQGLLAFAPRLLG